MPNTLINLSLMTDDGAGIVQRNLFVDGTSGLSITFDHNSMVIDASALVSGLTGQLNSTTLNALLESDSTTIGITHADGDVSLDVNQGNLSLGSIGGSLNLATQVAATVLPTANGGTGNSRFSIGQATFVSAGQVDVADATITGSSKIVVSQVGDTPAAEQFSVTLNPTTGFSIFSTNASSVAVVDYIRVG